MDEARLLFCGDSASLLADWEADSLDALVSDPPYGLTFMGKGWDDLGRDGAEQQLWHQRWAAQVLRVLKPGAHGLIFGGTRTYHRLACAFEDVGFELRDCLMWLHGQGFPKGYNLGRCVEKLATMGTAQRPDRDLGGHRRFLDRVDTGGAVPITAVLGARWEGWNTTLKPAWEPILLVRKPLSERNIAANVLRWGVGAVNIDGCRLSVSAAATPDHASSSLVGRWPANVILEHLPDCRYVEQMGSWEDASGCPVKELDRQSGLSVSADGQAGDPYSASPRVYGKGSGRRERRNPGKGDVGGASRFFYIAKAPPTERWGLVACPACGTRNAAPLRHCYGEFSNAAPLRHCYGEFSDEKGSRDAAPPCANCGQPVKVISHPTQKPLALIRWLVRLITPLGGVVLDPFLGSGTTAVAAAAEGLGYLGIDAEPDYITIAEARLAAALPAGS